MRTQRLFRLAENEVDEKSQPWEYFVPFSVYIYLDHHTLAASMIQSEVHG